jgi:hypothetical protein
MIVCDGVGHLSFLLVSRPRKSQLIPTAAMSWRSLRFPGQGARASASVSRLLFGQPCRGIEPSGHSRSRGGYLPAASGRRSGHLPQRVRLSMPLTGGRLKALAPGAHEICEAALPFPSVASTSAASRTKLRRHSSAVRLRNVNAASRKPNEDTESVPIAPDPAKSVRFCGRITRQLDLGRDQTQSRSSAFVIAPQADR